MKLKELRLAASNSDADTGGGIPGDERENLISLNALVDFFHTELIFRFFGEPRFWRAAKLFAKHVFSGLTSAQAKQQLAEQVPLAQFILNSFFEKCLATGRNDVPCYSGPKVNGHTEFVAAKWLQSAIKYNVKGIHTQFAVNELIAEVKNTIDTLGEFAYDLGGELDVPVLNHIHTGVLASKRDAPDPGSRAIAPRATTLGNQPVWFTSRQAFEDEVGTLANDTDGVAASCYAAGLRRDLGLHHDFDRTRDSDVSNYAYRIVAIIDAVFSMSDLNFTAQPSIFSGGDPELFVSRKKYQDGTGSGMDGKTVRLKDSHCPHTGTCLCGKPGVPEAVTPESVFVQQRLTLKNLVLVSSKHLRRYSKPELSDIRRNNSYGT